MNIEEYPFYSTSVLSFFFVRDLRLLNISSCRLNTDNFPLTTLLSLSLSALFLAVCEIVRKCYGRKLSLNCSQNVLQTIEKCVNHFVQLLCWRLHCGTSSYICKCKCYLTAVIHSNSQLYYSIIEMERENEKQKQK